MLQHALVQLSEVRGLVSAATCFSSALYELCCAKVSWYIHLCVNINIQCLYVYAREHMPIPQYARARAWACMLYTRVWPMAGGLCDANCDPTVGNSDSTPDSGPCESSRIRDDSLDAGANKAMRTHM